MAGARGAQGHGRTNEAAAKEAGRGAATVDKMRVDHPTTLGRHMRAYAGP